jgi:hypothetical protein
MSKKQSAPENLVPIMPVPVVMSIGTVRTRDGNGLVEMTASTPLGKQSYFIEPDAAAQIASTLVEAATVVKNADGASKIVVPDTASIIDINKNGHKEN